MSGQVSIKIMPENKIEFLEPLDPKFAEAEDWRIKKLLIEKVNEIAAALNNLIDLVQNDDDDDDKAGENDNDENNGGNDNLQQGSWWMLLLRPGSMDRGGRGASSMAR